MTGQRKFNLDLCKIPIQYINGGKKKLLKFWGRDEFSIFLVISFAPIMLFQDIFPLALTHSVSPVRRRIWMQYVQYNVGAKFMQSSFVVLRGQTAARLYLLLYYHIYIQKFYTQNRLFYPYKLSTFLPLKIFILPKYFYLFVLQYCVNFRNVMIKVF